MNKKVYLSLFLLVSIGLFGTACSNNEEEQTLLQVETIIEDEVLMKEEMNKRAPNDLTELTDNQLQRMAKQFEIDISGLSREEIILVLKEKGIQMGKRQLGMGLNDLTDISDELLQRMAEQFEIDTSGLSRVDIIELLEENRPQMDANN
ncbi:hypothetical protein [Chengkuizengella sediminis]|uniref:hypothetical protein n=1 Tax=Chengkuizengella sediminis TaxID=1885917 RepID=UPI00138A5F08|nr:hypothetical protein [Chengkuizengella sediminis]NDI33536.1 hypothetical protein [Chengkuizengella sediminis]